MEDISGVMVNAKELGPPRSENTIKLGRNCVRSSSGRQACQISMYTVHSTARTFHVTHAQFLSCACARVSGHVTSTILCLVKQSFVISGRPIVHTQPLPDVTRAATSF